MPSLIRCARPSSCTTAPAACPRHAQLRCRHRSTGVASWPTTALQHLALPSSCYKVPSTCTRYLYAFCHTSLSSHGDFCWEMFARLMHDRVTGGQQLFAILRMGGWQAGCLNCDAQFNGSSTQPACTPAQVLQLQQYSTDFLGTLRNSWPTVAGSGGFVDSCLGHQVFHYGKFVVLLNVLFFNCSNCGMSMNDRSFFVRRMRLV
eukprot:SAG31_NODE_573_length_13971_cov_5.931949_7_plen_204_part_00